MSRYYAPDMFRRLNGVFCAYKPPQWKPALFIDNLIKHINMDMNSARQRPLKQKVIYHDENWETKKPLVSLVDDLSDHVLVKGPRFMEEDFLIHSADDPHLFVSGLLVCGINECPKLDTFIKARFMKVYHLKGRFGRMTDDFTSRGVLRQKTTWRFLRQDALDRVLASIQAAQQKNMFTTARVDLQSEEAYEMAAKGLLRARTDESKGPVIYGIKCIDFDLPEFTLEVHCVNENLEYLAELIHTVGLEMRSSAVCTQASRIRWGKFTLNHAIKIPFNTFRLANSIQECERLLEDTKQLARGNIVTHQLKVDFPSLELGDGNKELSEVNKPTPLLDSPSNEGEMRNESDRHIDWSEYLTKKRY